ncbi:MAG: serine/threonine-protein phosphatase [Magnetococcales bacterium]|nr:serine/threonine-protein phosphatase [Magnetococcales bacterium]
MILNIGDRLLAAGKTDVGCVRTLNEDSLFIDDKLGLLIIADGMGGHSAGEVASAQVITSVCQSLNAALETTPQEAILAAASNLDDEFQGDDEATMDDIPNPIVAMLRDAANAANTAINDKNRADQCGEGTGMGSTLVGCWLPSFSEVPVVFHVGDSRLYYYNKKGLTQVTQDHSMYQRWVNLGSKGPAPAQNILLQAVGPSEHITPDINFQEVEKGDVVLLCSDGLTGMVSTKAIEKVLATAKNKNLDDIVDQLIKMARDGGGKDNISVIVGRFIK